MDAIWNGALSMSSLKLLISILLFHSVPVFSNAREIATVSSSVCVSPCVVQSSDRIVFGTYIISISPDPFSSALVNDRLHIDWNVPATLLVNSLRLQERGFVYIVLLFCTSNQPQRSNNVHDVF